MDVVKIGMLTPSSNTCLEPLTQAMIHGLPGVSLHFSRVPVVTIGLSADESAQFEIDTMVASARLLADAGVDVIAWNGTAGSWLGLDHDRSIVREITQATGTPATTSTLAFFDAFAALGVKSYGLAVPYTADVTQQIISTYAAEGMSCAAEAHLDISLNTEIGKVPEGRIAELMSEVAVPEAEVILAVCTNFWGGRVAPEIERERGIPVLDSVAVTLWHSLLLAGYTTAALESWGQIFRAQTLTDSDSK